MSFLSTTENVGFSGIPQSISETSCATQYKMGVEGVSGSGDMNIFIHDSSGDEQNYIPHLNDNFFHTKFKIDPNDLYTFHDSDIIAGEITVSHTEDSLVFQDDVKTKLIDTPIKHQENVLNFNGEIKEEVQTDVILNGHQPTSKTAVSVKISNVSKTTNAKVPKIKNQTHPSKEQNLTNVKDNQSYVKKEHNSGTPHSCNSTGANITNIGQTAQASKLGFESFLDVFKREQGVVVEPDIKTEPATTPMKHTISISKKTPSAKPASQPKPKRGRGPTVHEALQRIPPPTRALAVRNSAWHAPGQELYSCGPLDEQHGTYLKQDSSSSDDDYMPDFELGVGPVCVEETAAESRGARLALRRAALRRHVASVHTELRLASDLKKSKALVSLLKKQLKRSQSPRLPTPTVNYLLANHRMPSLLTSRERRHLREQGWSGGSAHGAAAGVGGTCAGERCGGAPLPCSRYCARHVAASEQRLFAACAAVFAGGARCRRALLPLRQHTPLCAEHAWKRDNYDKLSRDSRGKRPAAPWRAAPAPRAAAAPAPHNRVARPAPRRRASRPAPHAPSNAEMSVCSNSSTYDSSEDAAPGALSEGEYADAHAHELDAEGGEACEGTEGAEGSVGVAEGAGDELLDPAVLSQIPDVAFTEFFNQAEGEAAFAESSELAAALEAVLDEGRLDAMDYAAYPHAPANKIPVATSVSMELSSSAPS